MTLSTPSLGAGVIGRELFGPSRMLSRKWRSGANADAVVALQGLHELVPVCRRRWPVSAVQTLASTSQLLGNGAMHVHAEAHREATHRRAIRAVHPDGHAIRAYLDLMLDGVAFHSAAIANQRGASPMAHPPTSMANCSHPVATMTFASISSCS